jgi:hypothetical protein
VTKKTLFELTLGLDIETRLRDTEARLKNTEQRLKRALEVLRYVADVYRSPMAKEALKELTAKESR